MGQNYESCIMMHWTQKNRLKIQNLNFFARGIRIWKASGMGLATWSPFWKSPFQFNSVFKKVVDMICNADKRIQFFIENSIFKMAILTKYPKSFFCYYRYYMLPILHVYIHKSNIQEFFVRLQQSILFCLILYQNDTVYH